MEENSNYTDYLHSPASSELPGVQNKPTSLSEVENISFSKFKCKVCSLTFKDKSELNDHWVYTEFFLQNV